MSLIIDRALAKQQANKSKESDDITVGNLLDTLYELVDSGKVNPNARVIFMNDLWCLFMCRSCGKLNEKHWLTEVLKYKIDSAQSDPNTLRVFVKSHRKIEMTCNGKPDF